MYKLLPFRFHKANEEVFLSNEAGEYAIVSVSTFEKLINYTLNIGSEEYINLKSKFIIADDNIAAALDMLSIKYRTKKSFLYDFTSLHMVVPTLCCNSKCTYCQVSSKNQEEAGYYMDNKTAKAVVETIFKSPSKYIKIEFQGGEPLLNLDIVKYIVAYANALNRVFKKHLQFVVCTNLTLINKDILSYFASNNIHISTSLDGPKELHTSNRPLKNGKNSYDVYCNNLKLAKEILGKDRISALMTTTRASLKKGREIVDEYVNQGFNYIFMRNLNPYGQAIHSEDVIGYKIEEFIGFYKNALKYIIEVNLKGYHMVEGYASILLKKILTPFSTGFVDLQSPAGVGISSVIYNYDGNVYASDEGRMLASMGDNKFLLGNVTSNSYEEIFGGQGLFSLIKQSCSEIIPGCAYCAYLPFCGADPVRNYVETGDIVGNRTRSLSCKKNMAIIQHLLELIQSGNDDILDVFWSWITNRSLRETKIKQ